MRINDFVRANWRTWFAVCLIPIQVYVAVAFLWVIKWKMDLPEDKAGDWFAKSDGLQYAANLVTIGYFSSVILLSVGGLIQFCLRCFRAATTTMIFALAALIIGICLGNFAIGIQHQRLDFLTYPIL
jgi:hypothetical protein